MLPRSSLAGWGRFEVQLLKYDLQYRGSAVWQWKMHTVRYPVQGRCIVSFICRTLAQGTCDLSPLSEGHAERWPQGTEAFITTHTGACLEWRALSVNLQHALLVSPRRLCRQRRGPPCSYPRWHSETDSEGASENGREQLAGERKDPQGPNWFNTLHPWRAGAKPLQIPPCPAVSCRMARGLDGLHDPVAANADAS